MYIIKCDGHGRQTQRIRASSIYFLTAVDPTHSLFWRPNTKFVLRDAWTHLNGSAGCELIRAEAMPGCPGARPGLAWPEDSNLNKRPGRNSNGPSWAGPGLAELLNKYFKWQFPLMAALVARVGWQKCRFTSLLSFGIVEISNWSVRNDSAPIQ